MQRESFFSIRSIFQDRRKLTVFIVCVILSALSWVMISLGKEYNTTLLVPVKYINFPQNKTLLNQVPSQLAVNVGGSGFGLLQLNELTDDTLIVNLDNLQLSSAGDYLRGYLDQTSISRELQNRLRGDVAINRVLTDSINFIFDLRVSRTFLVKPRLSFEVMNGYVQSDSLVTEPIEIEVYGALSILDTMEFVRTEPIQLGQIKKSQQVKAALDLSAVGGDAVASVDSVLVFVGVDQLTEVRFMLKPEVLNLPDSLELLTFPTSVEVVAQVPLGAFERVKEAEFELSVDYAQLKEGYMVLPVELSSWSPIAKRVSLKPEQVEIVIAPRE